VKDSKFFADHIMSVDVKLDPVFGNGLFVLKGQRWRQVKVNLTPIFTSGKMKNMFYLVDLCCKELIELLDRETAKGEFKAKYFAVYTETREINIQKYLEIVANFSYINNILKFPFKKL
jgi:cytochrome P450